MIGRRGFFQVIGAAVLGCAIALKSTTGPQLAERFVRYWDPIKQKACERYDVFLANEIAERTPKHEYTEWRLL